MVSAGGGKSDSKNGWSFNQSIPGFQSKALKNLFNSAQSLYGDTYSGIKNATGNAQDLVNAGASSVLPAFNSSLEGGEYKDVNANDILSSINSSINTPTETSKVYADIMGGQGNNYADALKASYLGDANRATDNMLSNLDARAAASGMSGGARHGIATAQGMYDINSNLQKNLAQTGYDTFNQDLNNKLGIAQQADSNTLQRQQMLTDMLGQKQNTVNSGMNFGQQVQNLGLGTFAPTMMPWNAMQNYAATLGNPIVLSNGSGSGSSKGKGGGLSLFGG